MTHLNLSYGYTTLFFRLSSQQVPDALYLGQIQSIIIKCPASELSSFSVPNSLMVWRVARADCMEKSSYNRC